MPSSNPQDSSPTPLGDGAFPDLLGNVMPNQTFHWCIVNQLQYKHRKSHWKHFFKTKMHPAGSSCRGLEAFHHGCESKASSIRLLAVHQGSFDLSNGKNACLTIPKTAQRKSTCACNCKAQWLVSKRHSSTSLPWPLALATHIFRTTSIFNPISMLFNWQISYKTNRIYTHNFCALLPSDYIFDCMLFFLPIFLWQVTFSGFFLPISSYGARRPPPKINTEPKKRWFPSSESPIPGAYFQIPC